MKKLLLLLLLSLGLIGTANADSSDADYWDSVNAVDIEYGEIFEYHNICEELPTYILRYIVDKISREYDLTEENGEYFLDLLQQSNGFYLGRELVKADGCIKARESIELNSGLSVPKRY